MDQPYLVRVQVNHTQPCSMKAVEIYDSLGRSCVVAYSQLYTRNEKKYKEDDSATNYWYEHDGKKYVIVPRWLAEKDKLKFEEL